METLLLFLLIHNSKRELRKAFLGNINFPNVPIYALLALYLVGHKVW